MFIIPANCFCLTAFTPRIVHAGLHRQKLTCVVIVCMYVHDIAYSNGAMWEDWNVSNCTTTESL